MPRSFADLARRLHDAGFVPRLGKGSHRVWTKGGVQIALSSNHSGRDAGHNAAAQVDKAIRRAQ